MSKCYWVSGTFNLSADNGLMVWGDNGLRYRVSGEIPKNLDEILDKNLHAQTLGRYLVCPFEPPDQRFDQIGICIEAAEIIKTHSSRNTR